MREEGKNCWPPARCVPATTNQCNNILPSTKLSNPRRSLINATFINFRHTPYTQSIINVVPQDNRYVSIVLAVQVSLRVSPSQEISSCTKMGYIFSRPPLCNNYLESGVMLTVGVDVTSLPAEGCPDRFIGLLVVMC
jgi:hypothetical protein